jgi:hypothetical protein
MPNSVIELKTIINQIDKKIYGSGMPFASLVSTERRRQKGNESSANIWDREKSLKPRYSIHKKRG